MCNSGTQAVVVCCERMRQEQAHTIRHYLEVAVKPTPFSVEQSGNGRPDSRLPVCKLPVSSAQGEEGREDTDD